MPLRQSSFTPRSRSTGRPYKKHDAEPNTDNNKDDDDDDQNNGDGPAESATKTNRALAQGARSLSLSLSLGRMRSTHACGVRAPRRVGWSRFMPYGSPLNQRNGHLPRCTAVFRHASCGLQRAAYLHMCARKKAPLRACSLSREEAQHARLRRARAAPRWLDSVQTLWKPTAPAGRPCPSVHGRASTCQPRPPTSRRSSRVRTRNRAPARSLSGGGAARALAACVRRAALVAIGLRPTEPTAPARWPSP